MKKFIRSLLSGSLLVFILLALELLVIVFLQFGLENFIDNLDIIPDEKVKIVVSLILIFVRIFSYILAIIILFRVINRMEDPEFKIPWIVGLFVAPFFASMMYIIFGNHGLRKRDRIIIDATKAAYNSHFIFSEARKVEYRLETGQAIGTFNYIHNTTLLGVHRYNRIKYYKNGETCFPELIEDLKKAEHFIFMEFFIITEGELWDQIRDILIDRARAGVDVRLIYDDMGCSGTIPVSTPRKLRKEGIKCYKFHPFRPILSGAFNNRDHRKIVIIDHKYGYTGGMNLADEYANIEKRFGYWKDTMVRIEGSAINNLIVTFLQNYNLAAGMVSDYNKYLNHEYPKFEDEGSLCPFGDGPGGIDDALIGEQNYINIMNYARKTIFISTPYLVPTYSLLDALRNAALRGVKVHLILPGIPDKKMVYAVAKSHFRYLLDAGVNIYYYTPGFNHMKSIIADDELAFVGTVNFDFRSLVHHFECGVDLYKVPCCKEIREDFDEMLEQCEKVPKDFKMRLGTRLFCALFKIFFPLL